MVEPLANMVLDTNTLDREIREINRLFGSAGATEHYILEVSPKLIGINGAIFRLFDRIDLPKIAPGEKEVHSGDYFVGGELARLPKGRVDETYGRRRNYT